MNKFLERVGKFAKNPYLQMFVAVVLIVSSAREGWGTVVEDASSGRLRASHGTLLLGIVHLMRTLPDVVEGVERAGEAAEARAAKAIQADKDKMK